MAQVSSPQGDLLRARAALESDKDKAARIRAEAKKADKAFADSLKPVLPKKNTN